MELFCKKSPVTAESLQHRVFEWGSADLNCGPSVPNARGLTMLPYYPSLKSLSGNILGTQKVCMRRPGIEPGSGAFCLSHLFREYFVFARYLKRRAFQKYIKSLYVGKPR